MFVVQRLYLDWIDEFSSIAVWQDVAEVETEAEGYERIAELQSENFDADYRIEAA